LIVHGIEPEVVHRTGIPIRAAFEKVLTLGDVSVRAPLRVLVTGGGFGVGPMRRIVRSFRGMTDVRLTVVCGHSQRLRAQVAADAAEYGLALEAVGFEPDMAARVSDAHVVIGKPGGLTVTETLAAGRPMVVVSATPGHEEANERLVVDGGAGIAVDADEAGSRTRELWYAHALGAMGARARRLVAPGAASRVADLVMEAAKLALPASATRMRLRRALAA
jgi:processive 1,2-diacylglycerol beta-glucosyltransferase